MYNQNFRKYIQIYSILIILLESWHYTNQLWFADHVLNLNIKKVTVISLWHLGVLGQIFDFEISSRTAKRLRRQANKWKITSSNPTNHNQKKRSFCPIWGYIYILVSTQKVKRCDFDFYNILIFWRVIFYKF